MHRTLITTFSKRITIPQLSPTHTKARVIKFLEKNGAEVNEYHPVMVIESSPDMITSGYRVSENHTPSMIIDTQDEGILRDLNDHDGKWLDIGTQIGIIDDGDPVDADWIWQAYNTDTE